MRLDDFMRAQALRAAIELQPIDGPGGRLFPPTYPPAAGSRDKAARHVVETLPSGEIRVLVDSVASQANRQEEALVAARAAGLIDFADVYVDLSNTEAEIDRLSATEMPHRLSDAILRDSEIDGVLFAKSGLGQQLLATTPADLSPILEASPTTLLPARTEAAIHQLRAEGLGIKTIAKRVGCGVGTVQRVVGERLVAATSSEGL